MEAIYQDGKGAGFKDDADDDKELEMDVMQWKWIQMQNQFDQKMTEKKIQPVTPRKVVYIERKVRRVTSIKQRMSNMNCKSIV